MKDFYSFREPPRPEFAAGLQRRLAVQERKRRVRAVVARFGASALVCGLAIVLNSGMLQRGSAPESVRASATLLLPVPVRASELLVAPPSGTMLVFLKAPPIPLSHHH